MRYLTLQVSCLDSDATLYEDAEALHGGNKKAALIHGLFLHAPQRLFYAYLEISWGDSLLLSSDKKQKQCVNTGFNRRSLTKLFFNAITFC
jgi:hypothetical protein